MKKKFKGGLLNELQLKINASKELQWQYQKSLDQIEIENERLNHEYTESMKIDNNLLNDQNLKFLLDYRQSIINRICLNNQTCNQLYHCLDKQKEILGLLSDCYHVILKNI